MKADSEDVMRFVAAALLLLGVSNVHAEERCFATDTPRQCVQRLITTRAYETAQAGLAATNTGPSTVASPIRSAVKDFLSAVSADIDGSSLKDTGTTLILDYNFPQTFLRAGTQLNLEATLPNPAPSAAVTTIIPNISSLAREDDVSVALSLNLVSRRFGRNVDRSLLDAMILATIAKTPPTTAAVTDGSYDTTFTQLVPDAAARLIAMAEFENAAIATMSPAADHLTADLGRLANNQPQLFATALYHRRSPLVGPDKRGFIVTWEIGTDNLNSFRREEGRDCETRGSCLQAFADYTVRTKREYRSRRLALAIEYGLIKDNDTGLGVVELATNTLTYKATYGEEVTSPLSGHPGRFDLALTYDGHKTIHDFTGSGFMRSARPSLSDSRQGVPPSTVRASAAATFTHQISDNLSFPLSVVRADHDEWLPPVVINFPVPGTHRHRWETEYHAAVRYQIPSFSRPSPKGSCCCR